MSADVAMYWLRSVTLNPACEQGLQERARTRDGRVDQPAPADAPERRQRRTDRIRPGTDHAGDRRRARRTLGAPVRSHWRPDLAVDDHEGVGLGLRAPRTRGRPADTGRPTRVRSPPGAAGRPSPRRSRRPRRSPSMGHPCSGPATGAPCRPGHTAAAPADPRTRTSRGAERRRTTPSAAADRSPGPAARGQRTCPRGTKATPASTTAP